MAVDLVFSDGGRGPAPSTRAASGRRATAPPPLSGAGQGFVYEYTYILDGRGMVSW